MYTTYTCGYTNTDITNMYYIPTYTHKNYMLRKYINNNKPRWTIKHIIIFIVVMNIKISCIYIIECTVWFCGFMLIAFCLHCEIHKFDCLYINIIF